MIDLSQQPERPLVCASILASDFGRVVEDARDVLGKGADLLHVDVMDGHFVGNLTMGEDMIRALRKHLPDTLLDVHLMVDHPAMFVEPFARAGANVFTFHAEVCDPVRARHTSAPAMIESIHRLGMKAGMAINPFTAPESVEPYLEQLDLVLVMSVHPGKGGQRFMPGVLEKTRWLKRQLKPATRLEMDGGLDEHTCKDAVAAGVDMLVTGSALFGAKDRSAVILAMRGR
ncbi:MAG: ribulose-phosphate 3-epimerase [Phycisphaera sp.]|nr:ribulose-phosphate 3-epimerase [Phycisphaera sp.]